MFCIASRKEDRKMEYRELMPSDMKSLGLLGYVITVNKQVHSYQLLVLSEYLQQFALTIEDTVLTAILDGVETAIPLSVAIEAFSKENRDVQATLVSLSIQLSNIDSRVDRAEETLLDRIFMASQLSKEEVDQLREEATNKAITVRSDNNQLFKPPFKRNVKKSLWQRILTFIKHLLRKIFKKRETEETATVNDDYVSAIARCAEVAKDDFSVVCPAYDRILGICRDAISSLQTINSNFSQEIGLSAEIGKLVAVFTDSLTKITENQTQLAKDALVQKERTLPDFTISLIGRTKAGKSTLHSVLTNEGREKIGVGLQRTTRYNRVYQWNLLRLIDTPGIGSAEAEGRTDDQIAASVLGESDIICCVIVDDSIQQDILEFIEKIAALNKPIVILLNHKENIRPAPKFRKYIESPKDWLETTGEANLQGHINRILRYATDKGFEHQITVFPVFLLAALMAGEEEYSKYQETLWDSSNVEGFVHQLKKWIIEAGPIKRSQTLLDETIRNFHVACNEIESGKSVIVGRFEELKSKKPRTLDALRKEQAKTLRMIEALLVEKYANLANQTAYQKDVDAVTGVGGGVFMADYTTLDFDVTNTLGFYGNRATNAADDIFANGKGTSVTLPAVENMTLKDFSVPASKLFWAEDYYSHYENGIYELDESYSSGTNLLTMPGLEPEHNLRYQFALQNLKRDHITLVGADKFNDFHKRKYVCLALGYEIFYVTIKKKGLQKGESAMFNISTTKAGVPNLYISMLLSNNNKAEKEGEWIIKRVALPQGTWTVAENINWSWSYTPEGQTFVEKSVDNDEVVFEFTNTKNNAGLHDEDIEVNEMGKKDTSTGKE